jgi:23S rRNA (adenine2503-C2)-methyltransferase
MKLCRWRTRNSIDEILAACRYYIERDRPPRDLRNALAGGVNCDASHADTSGEEAARHAVPRQPDPVELRGGERAQTAAPGAVEAFLKRLEERHISATRRREMGDDIEGACGLLRRRVLETKEES